LSKKIFSHDNRNQEKSKYYATDSKYKYSNYPHLVPKIVQNRKIYIEEIGNDKETIAIGKRYEREIFLKPSSDKKVVQEKYKYHHKKGIF
jgi:hypothetical protein